MDINLLLNVALLTTFLAIIYRLRDHIRARLKGMSYIEYIDHEIVRLERELEAIEKKEKDKEAIKTPNFLTSLRDTYMYSWQRTLTYIVSIYGVALLTQWFGSSYGWLPEPSWDQASSMFTAACVILLSAYVVNRKWPIERYNLNSGKIIKKSEDISQS